MKLEIKISAIGQVLENETFLTEALFFPEVLAYHTSLEKAETNLVASLKYILPKLPLIDIHRRQLSSSALVKEVSLTLSPNKEVFEWQEPLELTFHIVEWQHSETLDIVYVPALEIEIINKQKDRDKLPEKVLSEIKAELLRRKAANSLKQLTWLQRIEQLELKEISLSTDIRSPKQIALQIEKNELDKPSILKDIGTHLNNQPLPIAYEVESEVKRLADALTGRMAKSVLLVGSSGVGKTAIFHQLVKDRAKFQLTNTPFWATSGAKLVAGMSGFGMWQERCKEVWQEASKQKAVLFFGNLVELMHVGKSDHTNQGIASFFRPYLVRGDLTAVVECTPEQLPLIEKEDPHLLSAFQQIKIAEPDLEKGRAILLSYAIAARKNKPIITIEALELLDKLHRRYATYSAYPGRPLRFFKNLISHLSPQDHITLAPDQQITEPDIISAFSRETGLPLFLLDDRVKFDLTSTNTWFSERVIGQQEAVNCVIDVLAMVKAELTRPNKPIASFLFIGPTGVGKTEMAKSLAEFLFQNKERLSRFDMSEYSDPISVKRLIGGVFASEGLLTAKVREQPFSVILFDEFEKAHSSFFDLLLQVLGEGRLTDSGGKLADFRNSVVIMTSNLGAESFQKGIVGFQQDDLLTANKHFATAVREFLRPELYNRIDRIVPFTPLLPEIIKQITNRELDKITQRNGILYRGVTLQYSTEVSNQLAQKGYNPRYGARPLKRAIEQQLLVPLAERLNSYIGETTLAAEISLLEPNKTLQVTVRPRVGKDGRPISLLSNDLNLLDQVKLCTSLRRNAHYLAISSDLTDIQNEIFRLIRLEAKLKDKTWKKPADLIKLTRLPLLKKVVEDCKTILENVELLENNLLLAFYGKEPVDRLASSKITTYSEQWQAALLNVYALKFSNPNFVTLAFYGENHKNLFEVAKIYYNLATNNGAKIEVFNLKIDKEQQKRDKSIEKPVNKESKQNEPPEPAETPANPEKTFALPLIRERVIKVEKFLDSPSEDTFTILLAIDGALSYLYFSTEAGLHIFKGSKTAKSDKAIKCFVDSSTLKADKYLPPPNINRRSEIENKPIRREYNLDQDQIEDMVLKKKINAYGRELVYLQHLMWDLMKERLLKVAKDIILQVDE